MVNKEYSKEVLEQTLQKLEALVFVDEEGNEKKPTQEQIEKMLVLCKKRNRPSYYKLRHASGMSEAYTFKGVDMYSNDGKKMRRFESGLVNA